MKKVTLIITGGIAAYKSLELIRLLKKKGGYDVRCVLTEAAQNFITPLSASVLSENEALSDMFYHRLPHIRPAQDCDLMVVAPATANTIAKMANGIADNLPSTMLMATTAPVLVAPGMNTAMWEHAATVANMETLKERGVQIIGPNDGSLACGDTGKGRMAEPEEILKLVAEILGTCSGKCECTVANLKVDG